MRYRLLATDVDETLLPHAGGISDRVRAAIGRAQQQGVLVTLASGRTFGDTSKYARELGIDLPLISHQGALVKHPLSGEVLHEDLLPTEIMREVIHFCRERDLHLNVYIDDETFMEKTGREFELYSALSRKPQQPVPDLMDVLTRMPTKFIMVSTTPEGIEATLPLVRAHFAGRLSVLRSHPLLIEGVMATVSKGRALAVLAKYLGVRQMETAAIGDNENDMEMLAWAGLGMAMGNATPQVQAVADCVLPPISEDGAAYGIERYVLNDGQHGR